MNRIVRLLASAIFLVALSPLAVAEEVTATNPAWNIESLNALVDQTNFIVDDKCSGTLISLNHKLILTNAHCVQAKISIVTEDVTAPDGSIKSVKRVKYADLPVVQNRYSGFDMVASASFQTQIVGYDKGRDLALLEFRQKEIPFTIAAQLLPDGIELLRGMRTVTVGNPAMLDASVVRGEISSLTRQVAVGGDNKRPFIQVSGGITGGNSGGGLFLDDAEYGGYLIGVPAAGSRNATFIGLAVPVSVIKEFLRAACFGDVWDKAADDAGCRKKKEGKEKDGKSDSAALDLGSDVKLAIYHAPLSATRRR